MGRHGYQAGGQDHLPPGGGHQHHYQAAGGAWQGDTGQSRYSSAELYW